ncbi:uncharacterized protein LOC114157527 isoform X2 [Xiphophorus couchianus]|uniref:uncharacterized protein LOC114157527 isoform X2 n=1 Tax=Xiphophorus couchianus TaxID=32473 RepID=UPI001015D010|nr:uncharacterized protein LOC114157527 isoform X2 [Xiphophorus couchianus]
MADEAVAAEQGASPAQSPLVTVTFQRNAKRTEKYLEAEPKVLGITQICFSVYMIISLSLFRAKGLSSYQPDIPLLVFSLLVIIAGGVAVAAKNLHLPTSIHSHFFAGGILIQACLLAISATLAAYCCKVINCCGAANKMPVITIQSPADQQREG